MPIACSISYNHRFPSRALSAYRIQFAETEAPVTGKLAGRNVVDNDVEYRDGVFASLREAVEAAYAYAGTSFAVFRNDDCGGDLVVTSVDARADRNFHRVATRTRNGVQIAAGEG